MKRRTNGSNHYDAAYFLLLPPGVMKKYCTCVVNFACVLYNFYKNKNLRLLFAGFFSHIDTNLDLIRAGVTFT